MKPRRRRRQLGRKATIGLSVAAGLGIAYGSSVIPDTLRHVLPPPELALAGVRAVDLEAGGGVVELSVLASVGLDRGIGDRLRPSHFAVGPGRVYRRLAGGELGPLVAVAELEPVAVRPLAGESPVDRAASWAIVLDNSGSMESNDPENQRLAAALDFVRALPPGSRVWVTGLDRDYGIYGASTGELEVALREAIGTYPASRSLIYDRLAYAVGWLLDDGAEAPAVLLLTDGQDMGSSLDADEVAARAGRNGIPISCVVLGPVDGSQLSRLAAATGGLSLAAEDAAELRSVVELVSPAAADRRAEVSLQVSLRWLDPDEPPSGPYELRARMRGPGGPRGQRVPVTLPFHLNPERTGGD